MGKILYGQDVKLSLIQGADLTDVLNFRDVEWQVHGKITVEQLIGLAEPRIDDVFDGCSGSFMNLPEDGGPLDLMLAIIDRQTNRVPDTIFDVTFLYDYADAGSRLLTFQDLAFGDQPNSIPSRDVHVTGKLNWRCGKKPLVLKV